MSLSHTFLPSTSIIFTLYKTDNGNKEKKYLSTNIAKIKWQRKVNIFKAASMNNFIKTLRHYGEGMVD